MDAKGGFTGIRAKAPRTIALIASLGAAFAVGGCGDDSGTSPEPHVPSPALLGVRDEGCAEIPPDAVKPFNIGSEGPLGFGVLPAEKVGLRLAAAWPSADLVVTANNSANMTELEKVGPSDTGRQSALKAAGEGYWVPEKIDPSPTPPEWTVGVTLPSSMRDETGGNLVQLELVSRTPSGAHSSTNFVPLERGMRALVAVANTLHPLAVRLIWRDRRDELGYLLERSEDGGPYTGLVSLGRDATTYFDTQVKGETTYSYRLTAQGCGAPGGPRTGSSTSTATVTTPKQ
jgi:hypothetical protein